MIDYRILGPLEVSADGRAIEIGGLRQRALLAILLLRANESVPRDVLVHELWGARPPPGAQDSLEVYISRLRKALAAAADGPVVLTRHGAYCLPLTDEQLDVRRFERLLAEGRSSLAAGAPEPAAASLRAALQLWRGSPLADLSYEPFAQADIGRLEEMRLGAVEDRIDADLALGRHTDVVSELEVLTAQHPLRERLWAQRMLALYRGGRQADALDVYQRLRATLVEELGIEPGAELRTVQQRILAQDPALAAAGPGQRAAAVPAVVVTRPVPVPRELPAGVDGFTGREAELAELDWMLPVAAGGGPDQLAGPVVISAVAGTAGVGKTALAVRWAHRVAGQFPDGQLYVNLRGYDPGQAMTPGEALAAFLRAMGVADQDIPLEETERAARYRSLLAGRRMLVVLDNAATEQQVRPMLPGTGTAMVLVTSRDSLAGLVARDGAQRLDLDLLPLAEAVTLLRTLIGERADTDPAVAETLAGLCARLPLALRVAAELAATRPEAPLAELVAELAGRRDRLELLDTGADPHSAVASVFSWSYQHLPADAARMFRLLGLHPGQDWDQYAAAALSDTASVAQAARMLGGLARAH